MLDEVYRDYERQANNIKNWRTVNKNDLIRDCIKHEKESLFTSYFAAIVCRYWYTIFRMYNKSHGSTSIEECYNWLIDAVLYALKHRSWMDPCKSIYKDPNGPDKVMNRCIRSARLIFYQSANSDNRRINFSALSSDQLFENYADAAFPIFSDEKMDEVEDTAKLLIEKSFKKKDYFTALMINCIVYGNVFDSVKNKDGSIRLVFNKKKLLRSMRRINNELFITTFSKQFSFDRKEVKVAVEMCTDLPGWKLLSGVNRNLNLLRKNELLQLN